MHPSPDNTLAPDTINDILSLLKEMGEWPLPVHRWPQVDAALADLEQASGGPDASAYQALGRLEILGPVRLVGIGEPAPEDDPVTMPPQIRERANRLVHSLSPQPTDRASEGEVRGDYATHD